MHIDSRVFDDQSMPQLQLSTIIDECFASYTKDDDRLLDVADACTVVREKLQSELPLSSWESFDEHFKAQAAKINSDMASFAILEGCDGDVTPHSGDGEPTMFPREVLQGAAWSAVLAVRLKAASRLRCRALRLIPKRQSDDPVSRAKVLALIERAVALAPFDSRNQLASAETLRKVAKSSADLVQLEKVLRRTVTAAASSAEVVAACGGGGSGAQGGGGGGVETAMLKAGDKALRMLALLLCQHSSLPDGDNTASATVTTATTTTATTTIVGAATAAGGAVSRGGALSGASKQKKKKKKKTTVTSSSRDKEAGRIMHSLGFDFRLSSQVLQYPVPSLPPSSSSLPQKKPVSATESAPAAPPAPACLGARVVDGALPPTLFTAFQQAMDPASPFWGEHRYHDPATGYFSYVLPTNTTATPTMTDPLKRKGPASKKRKGAEAKGLSSLSSPPSSLLSAVVAACRAHAVEWAPEVGQGSQSAEWWAHCRGHSSGHQLHFDSAFEGETAGGAQNPLVSCVLYLSNNEDENTTNNGDGSGGEEEGCGGGRVIGGPTLVTNQRLNDTDMATKGHLVMPKENRLCLFKGDLLHGVLPGRGTIADAESARRVTFMVAFWPHMTGKPYDPSNSHGSPKWPGPAFRLPSSSSSSGLPSSSSLSTVVHDDEEGGRGGDSGGGGGGGGDGMPLSTPPPPSQLKWPSVLLRSLATQETKELHHLTSSSQSSSSSSSSASSSSSSSSSSKASVRKGVSGAVSKSGGSAAAVINESALVPVAPVWERLGHVYYPKITRKDGSVPIYQIAPYDKCFQGF